MDATVKTKKNTIKVLVNGYDNAYCCTCYGELLLGEEVACDRAMPPGQRVKHLRCVGIDARTAAAYTAVEAARAATREAELRPLQKMVSEAEAEAHHADGVVTWWLRDALQREDVRRVVLEMLAEATPDDGDEDLDAIFRTATPTTPTLKVAKAEGESST